MKVYDLLTKVREQKPLVHHLTNWVTIYDCAQIVKSLGASPVMAHAKEEVADMASLASSLVLNIGTLTPEFVESMKIAAKAANEKGIPVVLDVCGAGATRLRDEKCFELINETRIDIIKGNASEVARIAGEDVQTKGVDASDVKKDLAEVAQKLASDRDCTVVITGEVDIIADNNRIYTVANGHEMMGHVVGTGCMATSVIGTFAGVESDLVQAGTAALVCFGIAAELAESKKSISQYDFPWKDLQGHQTYWITEKNIDFIDAIINTGEKMFHGPMSFKLKLFDEIYNLDKDKLLRLQKINELKGAL